MPSEEDRMTCPGCQHDNAPSSRFCSQCGAKLPAVCAQCAAPLSPNDRFCSQCGAAVATATPAATPAAKTPAPTLEAQFATLQQALPASFREQLLAPKE